MAVRTFAAIDVGSYELGMKIFEFSHKMGMKEIDSVRHSIELGTDTYQNGIIDTDHMDELCDVLSDFSYDEIFHRHIVPSASALPRPPASGARAVCGCCPAARGYVSS